MTLARPLALLTTSILFGFFAGQAIAQSGLADVPDTASGTYELFFDSNATGSLPYAKGEKAVVIIDGASNSLCIKGERQLFDARDSATFFKAANSFETTLSGKYAFTYTLQMENNAFKELFVYGGSTFTGNTSVTNQGYLRGNKINRDTDCSALGITPVYTLSTDEQSALSLGEELYPTMLVNGGVLGNYMGYIYRNYPSTGVYVGFKDGKIYTMGGIFGPAITEQGTVTAVLAALKAAKAKLVSAAGTGFTLSGATPATHNTTFAFTSGAPGVIYLSSSKTCQLYFENAVGSNAEHYFIDIRYDATSKALISAAISSGSFLVKSTSFSNGLVIDKAAGKAVFTLQNLSGTNGSGAIVNGSFALPANIPAACAL